MAQAANKAVDPLTKELQGIVLGESRPVTARQVTRRKVEWRRQLIVKALDEMTDQGYMAKFHSGLNCYYAIPKTALTGEGPDLVTVLVDSLKELFPARNHSCPK